MKNNLIMLFFMFFLAAGCSTGKSIRNEANVPAGKDTVVILYKQSKFKDTVIGKIENSLKEKDIEVAADNVRNAGNYSSSDYRAVIFMTDYQAWHVPMNARKYFKRNNSAPNIIFFITAGDPDLKIKKPFDAVTCSSRESEADRVASEIVRRVLAVQ